MLRLESNLRKNHCLSILIEVNFPMFDIFEWKVIETVTVHGKGFGNLFFEVSR